MKKVIVIGCPGSGKSTVSRALHNKTGIPLYHLDMMYWNADKTTVEKSVFLERLSAVLEKDEWIIDGNYGSTMELQNTVSITLQLERLLIFQRISEFHSQCFVVKKKMHTTLI